VTFFDGPRECGHDEVLGADHLYNLLVGDDAHRLEYDGHGNVLKCFNKQLDKKKFPINYRHKVER